MLKLLDPPLSIVSHLHGYALDFRQLSRCIMMPSSSLFGCLNNHQVLFLTLNTVKKKRTTCPPSTRLNLLISGTRKYHIRVKNLARHYQHRSPLVHTHQSQSYHCVQILIKVTHTLPRQHQMLVHKRIQPQLVQFTPVPRVLHTTKRQLWRS